MKVLESQSTPNPNALKLVLDTRVAEQPQSFFNAAAAEGHSLASAIFAIKGVTSLLLLHDFITVSKSPETAWKDVTPKVKKVIAGFSVERA